MHGEIIHGVMHGESYAGSHTRGAIHGEIHGVIPYTGGSHTRRHGVMDRRSHEETYVISTMGDVGESTHVRLNCPKVVSFWTCVELLQISKFV